MTELRMRPAEAEALVRETMMRCKCAAPVAEAVARALIGAELAGQGGHGLRRVPSYAAQSLSGKVDGRAKPSARQIRPGALAIDARHGFAYPALDVALDWLPGAARAQGIAAAGITRSHHCGVAGLTVEALARQGIAALMLANAPAAMAPWGAQRALFGTDPVAFGAPVAGDAPVVVDVSLSKVARGKIMAAAQKGEAIPEGWALDPEGAPTTDPQAALAGTMVPMGDAKGVALALMVEMLCAGLTGANFGFEASSFFDGEGPPPGTGQILIAFDPALFGVDGLARIGALVAQYDTLPGARLPGRRRQAIAADLARDGIPADPALVAQIEALGR